MLCYIIIGLLRTRMTHSEYWIDQQLYYHALHGKGGRLNKQRKYISQCVKALYDPVWSVWSTVRWHLINSQLVIKQMEVFHQINAYLPLWRALSVISFPPKSVQSLAVLWVRSTLLVQQLNEVSFGSSVDVSVVGLSTWTLKMKSKIL